MSKANDAVATKGMLEKAVDDIAGIIDIFATRVDERFNKMEVRMDRIEMSLERLTNTIDGLIARIDKYETEQAARDAEVNRIKQWVKQIADETGVKLKGFSN